MKTENSKFYKSFFIMLFTIAMQNVLVYGVNLADNIMLGRYSEISMSAVSIVNQIQFLLQMLISGVGEGIIVLASRYWGKEDIPSIKKASSVGMRWALAFSMIMFGLAFFFPKILLGVLTNQEPLIAEATRYLRIIAFTYPIFAITNVLVATLRSVETAKIGFYISLSTIITNVTLNYLLIFGKLGLPELGVRGAAIATLIARTLELVIVTVYILLLDKKIRLKIKDYFVLCRDMSKSFVKTSIPVVMSSASWGIAMALQTAILGRLDDTVIPANSISSTVFSIVTVFIYGSSTAAAVALGKRIGEHKKALAEGRISDSDVKADIKGKARRLQIIFLTLGLLTSLLLFILKDFIIDFYDISEGTKKLAQYFMSVLCVTVIGTSYQMPSLTGIIRAGGETDFVFYNDLIFMWGLVLPSSFAAAFLLDLSPVIVFICLKSDQILKCFVAVFKVNRFNWIKDI